MSLSTARPPHSRALHGPPLAFNPWPALHLKRRRRVTLSPFKGKMRVDVREFYDDGGVLKHGKDVGAPTPACINAIPCRLILRPVSEKMVAIKALVILWCLHAQAWRACRTCASLTVQQVVRRRETLKERPLGHSVLALQGLNMDAEQWGKLVDALPQLLNALSMR